MSIDLSISAAAIWTLVGVVLILAEFAMPGVILVFFGVAALLVGLLLWVGVDMSLNIQILVFGALAIGEFVDGVGLVTHRGARWNAECDAPVAPAGSRNSAGIRRARLEHRHLSVRLGRFPPARERVRETAPARRTQRHFVVVEQAVVKGNA